MQLNDSILIKSFQQKLGNNSQSTQITETPSTQRSQFRRFTRSGSKSRSKSHEDERQQASLGSYIKTIVKSNISSKEDDQQFQSRFIRSTLRNSKREITPVKSKKKININLTQDKDKENLQSQLSWLEIQRRLQFIESQNQNLKINKKKLQQRLYSMEQQIKEIQNQNDFYKEKIKNYEKQSKACKQKNGNILKIKREITMQKCVDYVPIQIVQDQLLAAQKQIQILKQSLGISQKIRQETLRLAEIKKSEKQAYLEDLIKKLKIEFINQKNIIDKMKIQLNVFMVRQSKFENQIQLNKNKSLQSARKKYTSLLKKYHQITQEFSTYKIKMERTNFRFSHQRYHRTEESSLSLSP